jgi:hypothetical protein
METKEIALTEEEIKKLTLKAKADYQKAWSRANKDKVRKNQQNYWRRRALEAYQKQQEEERC